MSTLSQTLLFTGKFLMIDLVMSFGLVTRYYGEYINRQSAAVLGVNIFTIQGERPSHNPIIGQG